MIYICVPSHDEARTVGVLLWKIRKVMADFGRDYRILVLDDASTDDTRETLDRYARSLPLTVIRSEERLGYGAAVDRLLKEVVERAPYPKRDCAVVLQADFTEDPADIVELVKVFEGGADIVAGTRDEPDEDEPKWLGLARWLAPRVLGRTHRDAPVSDPLTGLRVYRVIVLKKALREGTEILARAEDRWSANLEVLRSVAHHARKIEEVRVRSRYGLQARPSRFRPLKSLRDLLGQRGGAWAMSDDVDDERAA